MDSITKRINEIDILTDSQNDRMALQESVQLDLIKFIQTNIEKVNEKNSFLNVVIEEAKAKFEEEKEQGTLSWPLILKLIEIFSKNNNDIALGLMGIIKGNQKTVVKEITNNSNDKQQKLEESPLTNADLKDIKEKLATLSWLDKIKDSEFNNKE